MKHWYRPLAFYLAMEAAALLCRVALQAAGFQRHVWMGHGYYTKNMPVQHPHKNAFQSTNLETAAGAVGAQQDVPLVLLHGIGMGLIPYISCLFSMAATGASEPAHHYLHQTAQGIVHLRAANCALTVWQLELEGLFEVEPTPIAT